MADWSLWLLEWWEHWEHCPCHQKVIPNYQYSMLQYIITMHCVHAESTDFANNWSKAMLSIAPSPSKPFALKKVIKSIKLKVWTWQHNIATTICFPQIIQDINSLKRLLKEAESSYYALYKLVMSTSYHTLTSNLSLFNKVFHFSPREREQGCSPALFIHGSQNSEWNSNTRNNSHSQGILS